MIRKDKLHIVLLVAVLQYTPLTQDVVLAL